MPFGYCPDCGGRIYLGDKPWLGQPTTCYTCDADLEVTALNPPVLDWVDELAEDDWQDSQEPEWELELEEA